MPTIDLAQALEKIEPAVRGPRCSAGLLLQELTEANRVALLAAMADPRKQTTDIHQILVDSGITNVALSAIGRHRVFPGKPRKCACRD